MKTRTLSVAFVAAAFAAALCVAPAQAFTIQNSDAQPGSGQGYLDLDKPTVDPKAPVSQFSTENGVTTYKSGNSTFQFGNAPSFNQKYSTENIFNPYTREGR
jgi:hypothetical protein